MDEIALQRRATALAEGLADLAPGHAVLVLQRAMGRVLSSVHASEQPDVSLFPAFDSTALIRDRRSRSKIERDLEVQQFIHEKGPRRTYTQIHKLCLARFGADRAPSKSSIHRYIAKLRDHANSRAK